MQDLEEANERIAYLEGENAELHKQLLSAPVFDTSRKDTSSFYDGEGSDFLVADNRAMKETIKRLNEQNAAVKDELWKLTEAHNALQKEHMGCFSSGMVAREQLEKTLFKLKVEAAKADMLLQERNQATDELKVLRAHMERCDSVVRDDVSNRSMRSMRSFTGRDRREVSDLEVHRLQRQNAELRRQLERFERESASGGRDSALRKIVAERDQQIADLSKRLTALRVQSVSVSHAPSGDEDFDAERREVRILKEEVELEKRRAERERKLAAELRREMERAMEDVAKRKAALAAFERRLRTDGVAPTELELSTINPVPPSVAESRASPHVMDETVLGGNSPSPPPNAHGGEAASEMAWSPSPLPEERGAGSRGEPDVRGRGGSMEPDRRPASLVQARVAEMTEKERAAREVYVSGEFSKDDLTRLQQDPSYAHAMDDGFVRSRAEQSQKVFNSTFSQTEKQTPVEAEARAVVVHCHAPTGEADDNQYEDIVGPLTRDLRSVDEAKTVMSHLVAHRVHVEGRLADMTKELDAARKKLDKTQHKLEKTKAENETLRQVIKVETDVFSPGGRPVKEGRPRSPAQEAEGGDTEEVDALPVPNMRSSEGHGGADDSRPRTPDRPSRKNRRRKEREEGGEGDPHGKEGDSGRGGAAMVAGGVDDAKVEKLEKKEEEEKEQAEEQEERMSARRSRKKDGDDLDGGDNSGRRVSRKEKERMKAERAAEEAKEAEAKEEKEEEGRASRKERRSRKKAEEAAAAKEAGHAEEEEEEEVEADAPLNEEEKGGEERHVGDDGKHRRSKRKKRSNLRSYNEEFRSTGGEDSSGGAMMRLSKRKLGKHSKDHTTPGEYRRAKQEHEAKKQAAAAAAAAAATTTTADAADGTEDASARTPVANGQEGMAGSSRSGGGGMRSQLAEEAEARAAARKAKKAAKAEAKAKLKEEAPAMGMAYEPSWKGKDKKDLTKEEKRAAKAYYDRKRELKAQGYSPEESKRIAYEESAQRELKNSGQRSASSLTVPSQPTIAAPASNVAQGGSDQGDSKGKSKAKSKSKMTAEERRLAHERRKQEMSAEEYARRKAEHKARKAAREAGL